MPEDREQPTQQLKPEIITILNQAGFNFSEEILFDDAENHVEIQGAVTVKSTDEAEAVVALAMKHDFGIMPIANLTSATDMFKGGNTANFKGWIGLKIAGNGQLRDLPSEKIDGSTYEPIPILNGSAIIFKSKNPKEVPHHVRVWAGVVPAELDQALKTRLGSGYTVHIDLTTKDQAQIGAIIATGGQGPVRQDATFNLQGLVVVDAKPDTKGSLKKYLEGENAVQQVGLCGLAGAITEADFEIIQEEPHEFGIFIPLQGDLKTGLTEAFPEIMARLAKFTENEWETTDQGRKLKSKHGPLHIKGAEIITRKDLSETYRMMIDSSPDRASGCVGSMLQFTRENRCEAGLMINCRTALTRDQITDYLEPLYDGENGVDGSFVSELKTLIQRGIIHPNTEGITPFFSEHMPAFFKARESIAVAARLSKKEGPTKSTDINLNITATDPGEIKQAYSKIWAIYHRYIQDADARDAKFFVYGHNHPNGVDAHIRITFPLSEQDHQNRAAENITYLESRQRKLYQELIALNGQHGICIKHGEKGRIISPAYTLWIEENKPEEAEKIWRYMQLHGGETFASRNNIFRLHAFPPRIRGGILNYFAGDPDAPADAKILQRLSKSIALWCQNSHRAPEAEIVFGEVLGLMRDWLKLDFSERVFFAESPGKALHSACLSLNDYKGDSKILDLRKNTPIPENIEDIGVIVTNNPAQLDDSKFSNCKKILWVGGDAEIASDTRQKADAVIYSAEAFGTGSEMGIIVTHIKTIQHARTLRDKGNNTGYVHSLIELNDMPHSTVETPKMQVIAELGCLIAEKAGQTHTNDSSADQKKLQAQKEFLTLNPGPSQVHPAIPEKTWELTLMANQLKSNPAQCRVEVKRIKDKLKQFLGIPSDYEIFFTGSATQAMEQIVESLGLDHSIVMNMGAFGDRFQSVIQKFSSPSSKVCPIQMRWGTGPNSRLDPIIGEIKSKQPRTLVGIACGLFMTGHETSTGVEADVSAVAKKLHPDILKIVDGTSEIGAIPRDFKDIDVYFGSFQKFFGVPSGIGAIIVSPRAMERARVAEKTRSSTAYNTFTEMRDNAEYGHFHNLRGILQLGAVLSDFMERGGISAIEDETRAKIAILLRVVDETAEEQIRDKTKKIKRLQHAVLHPSDRSRVMLHIVPYDRDAPDIKRKLQRTAEIGSGYGPYRKETLRAYCSPNIPIASIQKIASALRIAMQETLYAEPNRPTVSRKLEQAIMG